VSAAVESAIWGAGEASGVDAGLEAGEGCGGASWGNCARLLGDSLRTAVSVLGGLVDIFAMTRAGDDVVAMEWVMGTGGGDGQRAGVAGGWVALWAQAVVL
jgi:hypothetical protein